MIDPYNITNYDRTDKELQEFWLFCLAVAGKKATMMAKKVDDFLKPTCGLITPFQYIDNMVAFSTLEQNLRRVRMGKYALLEKGYAESVSKGAQWLRTASAEDIRKSITGAGYKTSRFFTLHSRRNENVAVIDTHMLKYLKHLGASNVPDGIPNGPEYLRLEKLLLAEAAKKKLSMADFDLKIWSHYASKGISPLP
jgi:thermostable 8-oxoguanine DNA glycosylase